MSNIFAWILLTLRNTFYIIQCAYRYLKLKQHLHTSFLMCLVLHWDFPGGSVVKNLPANAGDIRDAGLIPGLGRSPEGGHDNPLQCSCPENPMDRGAWQATVDRVAMS